MADPVAEKSGFLKMYMSNHPDTLVAYAKWFGKVREVITSAEMTAIDTKVRSAMVIILSMILMRFPYEIEHDPDLHSERQPKEGRRRSY
jgi:hypothetical protein